MAVGETVLVRSAVGDPVVKAIFAEQKASVLLCCKDEFLGWRNYGVEPLAVRYYPKGSVFKYDEELCHRLSRVAYDGVGTRKEVEGARRQLEDLWGLAQPYFGMSDGTLHL